MCQFIVKVILTRSIEWQNQKVLNLISQVIEAGLVQEFIKTTRVIALIEVASRESKQGGEQALLIFQTARVPVHSAIDLTIEQILPIDTNLKCEIGE